MKLIFCNALLMIFLGFNPIIPKYTWKGNQVTYKEWRDSLRVTYLKVCNSPKSNEIKKKVR